ncbi:MAG: histidine kinase [Tepidiformaceae bacterium]
MTTIVAPRSPAFSPVMAIGGWLAVAALMGVAALIDYRLSQIGRNDLAQMRGADNLWIIPVLTAATVGSALVIRRARHPAGYLFLALAIAITASGVLDGYAAYGAVARPGSLPGADIAAVLGDDLSFIPWLTILALILLVTPDGRVTGRRGRIAVWVAIVSGAVAMVMHLLEPYRGDYASLGLIHNPIAIDSMEAPFRTAGFAALIVLHAVLLGAAGAIVVRFRRAKESPHRQLRWMAFAAIPFPALLVGAFIAASLGNETVLGIMAGGFVSIIPIAAGLAIERDHLYDADRLLSRGLTYGLLTALVVASYAVVVVFVGDSLGDLGGSSQAPAVVATLAAMSVAIPLRRWIQDGIDRRFNRRRFDAVATVQRYVRDPAPDVAIADVLRSATGDATLAIAYWIEDRALWVTAGGEPGASPQPFVAVTRNGLPLARVAFDPGQAERTLVEAVSAAARSELENARLRAAIALQLVEVRESRSRIVEAQLAERHKIERNLHDGAQQRLLALALQLRAAEISGDPVRATQTLANAVDEIQVAVRELRELANGLHPAVLNDGGLCAALDTLAARTAVNVRLEATAQRFAPATEEAAWFIACEAVTNAVKHALPTVIEIRACEENGRLLLVIEDDGIGGADPAGRGLRGIADRAEAAGGRLTVEARPGGGTIVAAELPCAL